MIDQAEDQRRTTGKAREKAILHYLPETSVLPGSKAPMDVVLRSTPRIRLKTQPLIGILIKHIRNRLLILHIARHDPLRLQQKATLALDSPDLVRQRSIDRLLVVLERPDVIQLFGTAECEDGETVGVFTAAAGEEARDAFCDDVELGEVFAAVLVAADADVWVDGALVAVRGPG